jgi:3-oxoacyl-[acyl-carrier-protein] synthase II
MSGVCVTGVGLLTPLGDGCAAVAEALCAGRTALAPAPELEGAAQARIADFDANRYAKIRGMRLYNRATQLGICATKLALADAGLEASPLPPEQLGLVEASTLSHLDTLVEYDRSLVVNGTQRSNHSLMALSIPTAPARAWW